MISIRKKAWVSGEEGLENEPSLVYRISSRQDLQQKTIVQSREFILDDFQEELMVSMFSLFIFHPYKSIGQSEG